MPKQSAVRPSGERRVSLPVRDSCEPLLTGRRSALRRWTQRDRFLTDVLSRYVEWVPVCPEVEAGLGIPREAMRLVGDSQTPQLITVETERNITRRGN